MCMLRQLINTCSLVFFRTIECFPIQQSSLDNGDVTTVVLKTSAIMKTRSLDESFVVFNLGALGNLVPFVQF